MTRPTTPLLTVDAVVLFGDELVVVERKNPPLGWALPGGFVDVGEHLIVAASRELLEETTLVVSPQDWQFVGIFDDPARDPRGHTVTAAYVYEFEGQRPDVVAQSDAKRAQWISLNDLPSLVFDHAQIVSAALEIIRR